MCQTTSLRSFIDLNSYNYFFSQICRIVGAKYRLGNWGTKKWEKNDTIDKEANGDLNTVVYLQSSCFQLSHYKAKKII